MKLMDVNTSQNQDLGELSSLKFIIFKEKERKLSAFQIDQEQQDSIQLPPE